MSVDFYLVSPGKKRAVMVGSNGFSGPLPWPGTPECVEFIRWAIAENIEDIVFMNEYAFDNLRDDENWPEDYSTKPALPRKEKIMELPADEEILKTYRTVAAAAGDVPIYIMSRTDIERMVEAERLSATERAAKIAERFDPGAYCSSIPEALDRCAAAIRQP